MKLILDQGVPHRAAELLRQEGLDVVHASEVGLSTAADEVLLQWCREQEGLKGPEMARLVRTVIDRHEKALTSGAMLTVRFGRVRTHALPVNRRRK